MERLEMPAGEKQMIVLFLSDDTSALINPVDLIAEVAQDAAEREVLGWRLVSVGAIPLRQMGTAGNVLFQSGGQYATKVALPVVYARSP